MPYDTRYDRDNALSTCEVNELGQRHVLWLRKRGPNVAEIIKITCTYPSSRDILPICRPTKMALKNYAVIYYIRDQLWVRIFFILRAAQSDTAFIAFYSIPREGVSTTCPDNWLSQKVIDFGPLYVNTISLERRVPDSETIKKKK